MPAPDVTHAELLQAASRILINNLGLARSERLLVITDPETEQVGRVLFEAGDQLAAETSMVVIPPTGRNGAEPPAAVGAAMLQADVVLCPTRFSLSHTRARASATENGARVATMPGVKIRMLLEGPITADRVRLQERTFALQRLLTAASSAKIVTCGMFELAFSLLGREGRASTGTFLTPGSWGNLPSGEAYIAPIEGSANGTIVVNGSAAGIGRLMEPIHLVFSDGLCIGAEGENGHRLLDLLGPSGAARNVAEFGIGTNDMALVNGVILEDEKALGTIHIGLGDNSTFGGSVKAGVHLDVVVEGPDVFLDGTQIMAAGELAAE